MSYNIQSPSSSDPHTVEFAQQGHRPGRAQSWARAATATRSVGARSALERLLASRPRPAPSTASRARAPQRAGERPLLLTLTPAVMPTSSGCERQERWRETREEKPEQSGSVPQILRDGANPRRTPCLPPSPASSIPSRRLPSLSIYPLPCLCCMESASPDGAPP
jgi:hypothetical protein